MNLFPVEPYCNVNPAMFALRTHVCQFHPFWKRHLHQLMGYELFDQHPLTFCHSSWWSDRYHRILSPLMSSVAWKSQRAFCWEKCSTHIYMSFGNGWFTHSRFNIMWCWNGSKKPALTAKVDLKYSATPSARHLAEGVGADTKQIL